MRNKKKKIFRINMSELNGFCCCFLLTQRPLTIKNKKKLKENVLNDI